MFEHDGQSKIGPSDALAPFPLNVVMSEPRDDTGAVRQLLHHDGKRSGLSRSRSKVQRFFVNQRDRSALTRGPNSCAPSIAVLQCLVCPKADAV
jgi:hypothetical protein